MRNNLINNQVLDILSMKSIDYVRMEMKLI